MAARTAVMAVGALAAIIAVYLVVSAILGFLIWAAIIGVSAFAIVTAVRLSRGSAAKTARRDRVERGRGRGQGIVDCTGEPLLAGDTVRAGTGFDGPMELAFSRGVIVRLGQRKAHVRFENRPEDIYPIAPGALRRLG